MIAMSRSEHPIRNPYLNASDPDGGGEAELQQTISASARIGQIITFALVQGVVLFAGVAVYLVHSGEADDALVADPNWTLPLIGLGLALIAIVASWIVSGQLLQAALRNFEARGGGDPLSLLGGYRSSIIVAQAILEGAAMANGVLMILDRSLFHLPVIGVLILALVVRTPTAARTRAFLDLARESIADGR